MSSRPTVRSVRMAATFRVQRRFASAVIEFITRPLLKNPRHVGAALRDELEGVWSARRGTYRILYRVDDERREVVIRRIGHR